MKALLVTAALFAILNSVGCATISTTSATATKAIEAPSDLPDGARLNIALIEFDPGLPSAEEPMPDDVYPEIREAESKLLPTQLKKTLQETQQWGTVNVFPSEPSASDVTITGTILHSDGSELLLLIDVKDASGRTWFKKQFRTEAAEGSYGSAYRALDPHQPMYNTIANALVEARSDLDAEDLAEISTISKLQFASHLAPETFDGYLATDERGKVEIVRLPARDEPMLERVAEVRVRDEMFVDTMGIHYENYAAYLKSNYWHWREASSHELFAQQALRREQITRGGAAALMAILMGLSGAFLALPEMIAATVVGAAIIQQQIQAIQSLGQERELRQEALYELADSFQAEVEPVVVDLDTTTVRLTGTASAQYEEWQRLLYEVYRAENVMIADVYRVPRQPTEESWIGNNRLPMVPSQ